MREETEKESETERNSVGKRGWEGGRESREEIHTHKKER